jgi:hypothetical protein
MSRLGSEFVGECVSEGTLRTEDLIEACIPYLEEAGEFDYADLLLAYLRVAQDADYHESLYEPLQEHLSILLNEEVFPKMDDIAPEGTYFGTLEGDGACFGFWRIQEEEEEE